MIKKLDCYKTIWEDCTMSIVCPYCGDTVILDSKEEYTECDCGCKLTLYSTVYEIVEPENE